MIKLEEENQIHSTWALVRKNRSKLILNIILLVYSWGLPDILVLHSQSPTIHITPQILPMMFDFIYFFFLLTLLSLLLPSLTHQPFFSHRVSFSLFTLELFPSFFSPDQFLFFPNTNPFPPIAFTFASEREISPAFLVFTNQWQ